jgi:NIPSNAP
MLYRMRIYQAVAANLPAFHDYFREHLLPIQQRHGARLIGRWETEDSRVVAIWEYDDREAYEGIQAAVEADPDFAAAQQHRSTLPQLFTEKKDVLMTSTVSELWLP